MPTTNEILQDRSIRHATYLARLQSGTSRDVARFLEREVWPKVVAEVTRRLENTTARGLDVTLRSNQRLIFLQESVGKIIRQGYSVAKENLVVELLEIAQMETEFTAGLLQQAVPIDTTVFQFQQAGRRAIRQAVLREAFEGATLNNWWSSVRVSAQRSVLRSIQIGLTNGESVSDIASRLKGSRGSRGVFGKETHKAEAIARTAANHASSRAREETYLANKGVVKEVRWLSTLDGRTSLTCISLDGRVFQVGEGLRPPAHVNCRSTTTPVLASWERFGLKNPPDGTRASLNGQVPDKLTYKEWLRQQDQSVQDDVLGVGKAKLWRQGKVKIDKFVDGNLEPLTLKEVRAREGLDS